MPDRSTSRGSSGMNARRVPTSPSAPRTSVPESPSPRFLRIPRTVAAAFDPTTQTIGIRDGPGNSRDTMASATSTGAWRTRVPGPGLTSTMAARPGTSGRAMSPQIRSIPSTPGASWRATPSIMRRMVGWTSGVRSRHRPDGGDTGIRAPRAGTPSIESPCGRSQSRSRARSQGSARIRSDHAGGRSSRMDRRPSPTTTSGRPSATRRQRSSSIRRR